jgi:hypothetical protein
LHHRLLIDQLERLAEGEFDRLAIFMPPGSAKSTYGLKRSGISLKHLAKTESLPT